MKVASSCSVYLLNKYTVCLIVDGIHLFVVIGLLLLRLQTNFLTKIVSTANYKNEFRV